MQLTTEQSNVPSVSMYRDWPYGRPVAKHIAEGRCAVAKIAVAKLLKKQAVTGIVSGGGI